MPSHVVSYGAWWPEHPWILHGWVAMTVGIGVVVVAAVLIVMFILAFRVHLPSGPSPLEQERLPQTFDQDEPGGAA
jgi:hypothetical protein